MLERLGVAEVVDAVVPRRGDAGATVGTYMELATANRLVEPCSKAAFADWWATTAGPRWVRVGEAALDHRRFWEAMDRLERDRPGHDREPSWAGGWWPSSTWTCPGWCWT